MSASHAEPSALIGRRSETERLRERLRRRRTERRARRDFDAVLRAWTHGTPLPARFRDPA